MIDKNKWVVIGKDMDGLIGYVTIHSSDVEDYLKGVYSGRIIKGISLNRQEMQKLADELNAKNEPAPENTLRGVFKALR